jgi:hypothetical protein
MAAPKTTSTTSLPDYTKPYYDPYSELLAPSGEEEKLGSAYRSIYDKKRSYVTKRTEEMSRERTAAGDQNFTPADLRVEASKEFDQDFLMPLTSNYGEGLGDKVFDLFGPQPEPAPIMQLPPPAGEEVDFSTAFRPQTYLTELLVPKEEARINNETDIDFDAVAKALETEEKMSVEEAKIQASAIEAAYNRNKRLKPSVSPDIVFEETMDELSGLGKVIKGEGPIISEKGTEGPADPLYMAFVKGKQGGKVPDLSEGQLAYFDYVYRKQREKIAKEERERVKTSGIPYVELSDGSQYPVEVWDAMKLGGMPADMAPLSEVKRFTKVADEKEIEGRVNRRLNDEAPEIWWADPVKRPQVLSNPEAYYKKGIFSHTTPFGGTVETPAGWLFRSALTVPNLVAGAAFDAFASDKLTEKREEKRKEQTPLFAESPVLLNVAENRGFTGEFQEAGELLDYSPAGKVAMTAAGFALDLLDPTLGIASGVGKGTRTAVQVSKASKALYDLPTLGKALGAGAREGGAEFLRDFNVVSFATDLGAAPFRKDFKGAAAVAERLGVGDVRTWMGADLAGSLMAREAAKTSASMPDALTAIQTAGLSKTTYAKELARKAKAGKSLQEGMTEVDGIVRAAKEEVVAGSKASVKLLDEWDDATRALDNIAAGKTLPSEVKGVRTKSLARNLGAMAKLDPSIEAIFKAVDASPKAGPKIFQYVEALKADSPEAYSKLKRQFAYDTAMNSVYRNTKKMSGFDDVVAITKNTWARKQQASEILDHARDKTELGNLTREIIDRNVPILRIEDSPRGGFGLGTGLSGATYKEGRIRPYYDLSNASDLSKRLNSVIDEQVTYNKLKDATAGKIKNDLAANKIATEDLRILIGNNVDLVAEGKFATGAAGVRARDVARLTPTQSLRLLEPLEFRSFGRGVLGEFKAKNFPSGKGLSTKGAASVQQRRIVTEVQQRASAMDNSLRKVVVSLEGDKGGLRKIYNLPSGKLTRSQIVGAAIVGPEQRLAAAPTLYTGGMLRQEQIVADGIEWTLRRLFYSQKNVESLIDAVTGTRAIYQNKILSSSGERALKELVDDVTKNVIARPETYWEEVLRAAEEYRTIISDPDNLLTGIRSSDIKDVLKSKGSIPEEVQIGNYYWVEGNRIIDDATAKLIDEDESLGAARLSDGLDKKFASDQADFVKGYGIQNEDVDAVYRQLVKNRTLARATATAPLDNYSMVDFLQEFEDIVKAVDPADTFDPALVGRNRGALATAIGDLTRAINSGDPLQVSGWIGRNKDLSIYMSELYRSADDTAASVVRRNGLDNYGSSELASASREIESMFSNPTEAKFLENLFGKEIYSELKEAVDAGKLRDFDKYIDSAVRKSEGTFAQRSVDSAVKAWRAFNNLRYTFVLGLRPRFHGGNMLTANAITYASVGELVGPQAAYEAGKTIWKGSDFSTPEYFMPSGFKDSSGIPYTYGEIYDAVVRSGVRSEYGFLSDVMVQDGIIGFLTREKKLGTAKSAKELIDLTYQKTAGRLSEGLNNVTMKEDLMFRIAVAQKALAEGRTMDEAVELAKRSLFDYNDMSATERAIAANWFIFYSFTRQNFVDLLRSFLDTEKFKRTTNILKFDRGIENLSESLTGEDLPASVFFPDYSLSRIMYKKDAGIGRDFWVGSAPIPRQEALLMLAGIMSGDVDETLTRLLHPTWSLALDLESFKGDYKKIQPEHVWYISSIVNDDPSQVASIFEAITDGNIIPERATEEAGAINGWVYPLNAEQQKAYKFWVKSLVNFPGIGAPSSDFAKAVSGEGMTTQKMSAAERALLFTPALGTPIKVARPESQQYYDTLARLKEINAQMRKLDEEEKRERPNKGRP